MDWDWHLEDTVRQVHTLFAALTIDGYVVAEVVTGSFDSMDFLEFVQEQLVYQASGSALCK